MLEQNWALKFAEEWIASWNSHDLEKILSHYTEDFQMSSPLIVQRLGRKDGVLKGKPAVAEYWKEAMAQGPPLRFEVRDVLVGIDQLTIYYHSVGRKVVAETLTFNSAQKVIAGSAQWSVMSKLEDE
jgi:ketosteroid isomerase-like protein